MNLLVSLIFIIFIILIVWCFLVYNSKYKSSSGGHFINFFKESDTTLYIIFFQMIDELKEIGLTEVERSTIKKITNNFQYVWDNWTRRQFLLKVILDFEDESMNKTIIPILESKADYIHNNYIEYNNPKEFVTLRNEMKNVARLAEEDARVLLNNFDKLEFGAKLVVLRETQKEGNLTGNNIKSMELYAYNIILDLMVNLHMYNDRYKEIESQYGFKNDMWKTVNKQYITLFYNNNYLEYSSPTIQPKDINVKVGSLWYNIKNTITIQDLLKKSHSIDISIPYSKPFSSSRIKELNELGINNGTRLHNTPECSINNHENDYDFDYNSNQNVFSIKVEVKNCALLEVLSSRSLNDTDSNEIFNISKCENCYARRDACTLFFGLDTEDLHVNISELMNINVRFVGDSGIKFADNLYLTRNLTEPVIQPNMDMVNFERRSLKRFTPSVFSQRKPGIEISWLFKDDYNKELYTIIMNKDTYGDLILINKEIILTTGNVVNPQISKKFPNRTVIKLKGLLPSKSEAKINHTLWKNKLKDIYIVVKTILEQLIDTQRVYFLVTRDKCMAQTCIAFGGQVILINQDHAYCLINKKDPFNLHIKQKLNLDQIQDPNIIEEKQKSLCRFIAAKCESTGKSLWQQFHKNVPLTPGSSSPSWGEPQTPGSSSPSWEEPQTQRSSSPSWGEPQTQRSPSPTCTLWPQTQRSSSPYKEEKRLGKDGKLRTLAEFKKFFTDEDIGLQEWKTSPPT